MHFERMYKGNIKGSASKTEGLLVDGRLYFVLEGSRAGLEVDFTFLLFLEIFFFLAMKLNFFL